MVTEEELEELSRISVEENKALCAWFRHLTLVLSTVLGITVSLGSKSHDDPLCRYCFALAILLLSISIVGFFAVLYVLSAWTARKVRAAYRSELEKALRNKDYRMKGAGTNLPKWMKPIERLCYITASVGILLFGIYSFL